MSQVSCGYLFFLDPAIDPRIKFAVRGELTRTVQFAGRSTGQGDSNALPALLPCALDHRLLQHQSSARSTNPADKR